MTTPSRSGRGRRGIRVHSGATLQPQDITTHEGIPVTSIHRTLLDLGDGLDRHGLECAIQRAETLRRFDLVAMNDVLARANGRRGAATLREILDDYAADQEVTRNDFEQRLHDLCRKARLPRPVDKSWIPLEVIPGYEPDFLWPDHNLIVETDGFATHGTREAFEHDRLRDQRLTRLGYTVIRCTWLQIRDRPNEVTDTIRAILARSPGDGGRADPRNAQR